MKTASASTNWLWHARVVRPRTSALRWSMRVRYGSMASALTATSRAVKAGDVGHGRARTGLWDHEGGRLR
jgi:hypothetical protein